MKPNFHLPGGLRVLDPRECGVLSAFALTAVLAQPVNAQSLMVGADGAIHIDQAPTINVNDPVIIQQTPELIPPSMMQSSMMPPTMMQPGMPMSTPMMSGEAYGACVPFVPCSPVVTQTVQQQQPLPIAFSLFGEALYLRPHEDFVHAQQVSALGLPAGGLATNDYDYEPGVRVGGDIAVSPTNSLAASGSWFEADAGSSLTAPIGGAVASFVTVPAPGLLTSVTSSSEISFYTAEAEYRSRLLQGPRHWVNGGLGLRYAHLEQDFNQNSISLPLALDELAVNTDIEFDGGGPRLTLDGGRLLGNRGFSIYARSSVSPLTGKFHANYSFRNESTDTQLAAVNFEDHRIMTLFDYELGLAWTGPRKRWRFAAGYMQSYWFNAVTTADFIPAVQSGIYSDISDTIMFDGLTARVEHLW
ncbi:MAG: hypothetical protein H0T51_03235 [Pirellulales bacterium]|nr:hypothetical protein [Pirellulales bacterium]